MNPTISSQYEVIRELGRGGMGVVYLARNKLMNRPEVLKVLNKDLVARRGSIERFLREIQAAAKLSHQNVVTAYSAMQIDDLLVLAMEFVDGDDLSKLVKSRGPLPVASACYFAAQAAQGLQHAYERGMIHRDIKPHNLILARDGKRATVKILDFGLAKLTSEGAVEAALTHQGQMLGTPDYIAPEQTLDAQSADIRADIYSLGCTLYFLLTGRPPFQGGSLYQLLQAHQSVDAEPLNVVLPDVSAELNAVVARMMAKDPAQRYQTPAEVARALKAYVQPKSVSAAGRSTEVSQSRTSRGDQSGASSRKGVRAEIPQGSREHADAQSEGLAAADRWQSVIDFDELDRLPSTIKRTPKRRRKTRKRWQGASLVAGLVLLGIAIGWGAGAFKSKTTDGVAVQERSSPVEEPVIAHSNEPKLLAPKGNEEEKKEPLEPAAVPNAPLKSNNDKATPASTSAATSIVETPAPPKQEPPSPVRAAEPPPGELASKAAATKAMPEPTVQPTKEPPATETSASHPVQEAETKRAPDKPNDTPAPKSRLGTWSPLIEGNDFSGWTDPVKIGGTWKWESGVVIGYGGGDTKPAFLVSPRDDYEDFRIRFQVLCNDGFGGAIMLRQSLMGQFESGYGFKIGSPNSHDGIAMPDGSFLIGVDRQLLQAAKWLVTTRPLQIPAGQWYSVEIGCVGNQFTMSINGKSVSKYMDKGDTFKKGHIAFHCWGAAKISIRNIEIREIVRK